MEKGSILKGLSVLSEREQEVGTAKTVLRLSQRQAGHRVASDADRAGLHCHCAWDAGVGEPEPAHAGGVDCGQPVIPGWRGPDRWLCDAVRQHVVRLLRVDHCAFVGSWTASWVYGRHVVHTADIGYGHRDRSARPRGVFG